jgi:hypothetical protein
MWSLTLQQHFEHLGPNLRATAEVLVIHFQLCLASSALRAN